MKNLRLLSLVLLLNISCIYAQKLVIKPVPSWVSTEQVPATNKVDAAEVSNGYYYLLLDEQERIEEAISYNHYALHFLNEAGVSNGSEISIVYHPSYQQLIFHYVKLIRNGKPIVQPIANQVQFLQRETDLDYKMLDGSYTALISLKDVRKGDVLEYAYSIIGRNPIFQNKYYTSRLLSFGTPVVSEKLRYTWSANRKMFYSVQGKPIYTPKTTEKGNEKSLYIESSQLTNQEIEEEIPYDHEPVSPVITLSEFENWSEVVYWALPLYPEPKNNAANIKAKVKELTAYATTKEQKAQQLIRFVQDEIRYLGIETGESSHKPNAPEATLERRFGDCKDKTVLLRAMLHEVGITSYPMLVNTQVRDGIKYLLPGPQVFNHVVLNFNLNNLDYFVDATIAYQRGKLPLLQFPNYGSGLVIKSENTGLTGTFINERLNKREIEEYFGISDTLSPATLKVVTRYFGEQADQIRDELANTAVSDVQKNYLNFYQNLYGIVNTNGKMEVKDDEDDNILTTTEYYSILKPWTYTESTKAFELSVYAQTLRSMISEPKPALRKFPLGMRYPFEVKQTLFLDLPESWNLKEETKEIRNPAFIYTYQSKQGDNPNQFSISYHYLAGRDYIAVDEYEQYVNDTKKVLDLYAYSITWNGNANGITGNANSATNWALVFFSLLLFFASVFVAFRLYYRYDPIPKYGIPNDTQDLGGWLILVMIGLFASTGLQAYNFFEAGFYNQDTLNLLSAAEHPNYSPFWGLFFTLEIALTIPLFILTILCLRLLLKKRSSFPSMYITYLGYNLLLTLIQILMIEQLNIEENDEIYQNFFKAIVAAAIWIPYTLNSNRVRNTFNIMLNPPSNPLPDSPYRKPLYTYEGPEPKDNLPPS
jgi:multisubunit Na+/H+ antiporter MnhB subunit